MLTGIESKLGLTIEEQVSEVQDDNLALPTAPPSSSRAPPAQIDLPWDDGCM